MKATINPYRWPLFAAVLLIVLGAACGGNEEPTPTAVAQVTEEPTETPVPPTDTPAPTETPEPTETPLPTVSPPTPPRRYPPIPRNRHKRQRPFPPTLRNRPIPRFQL